CLAHLAGRFDRLFPSSVECGTIDARHAAAIYTPGVRNQRSSSETRRRDQTARPDGETRRGGSMAAAERPRRTGTGAPQNRDDATTPPAYVQPQLIPYTVHLPGFDGPLDLLLHLIERNLLEITTISLVAVTDQFVAYLRMWDEPPLPRLAEFVTMAA